MEIMDKILDLKLHHHCTGLCAYENEEIDEDEVAYETDTYLIRFDKDYFIGNFITNYKAESQWSYPNNYIIRDYLNANKENEVRFLERECLTEISSEDFSKIEFIISLNESDSFLPLALKEDKGQPQRAMINFLIAQSENSALSKKDFLDMLTGACEYLKNDLFLGY